MFSSCPKVACLTFLIGATTAGAAADVFGGFVGRLNLETEAGLIEEKSAGGKEKPVEVVVVLKAENADAVETGWKLNPEQKSVSRKLDGEIEFRFPT